MKGRIALVQFRSSGDERINLRRMATFVKNERGKSDLIVFPELAIKRVFSTKEERLLLKGLGMLAKANKIDFVPGSVMIKSGRKMLNRSYYIDREGRVLAKYDKTNLWKSERKDLTAGRGPAAFKTRFGNTAILICWDLASPGIASSLARLKLDLIICPSMWWRGSESGIKRQWRLAEGLIDSLCTARAHESAACVAFANQAGRLHLQGFSDLSAGRSQIVVPMSRPAISRGREENVVRYSFDVDQLKSAKKYFGIG